MSEQGAARESEESSSAIDDQTGSFIALRCRIPAAGADFVVETWRGPAVALAADGASGPAAYLLPLAALRFLRHLPASFIDRGRKHRATPLAKRLLGQQQIPFIEGGYRRTGRLEQSVQALLQEAARRHDANAYLIGVAPSLFDSLRDRARAGIPQEALRATPFTAQYLRLLEPSVIPSKLSKRLIGGSPEIDLVRQLIVLASDRDDPVLILGDTGTGKGEAAHAIHDISERRGHRSFVTVSCGAIAPELFEAELFGCTRDAFGGAFRRGKRGLWVLAQDGTLFLDDVADLLPRHQAMVLRALEDGKVRPAGASDPVSVHCRVIAATNRDVFSMGQSGTFREDLYYHLRPCLIRMPRLCDHPQDIPLLAKAFWTKVAPKRLELSDEVLSELARYRWPGNARELRAVLVGLETVFPFVRLRPEHVRAIFQSQRHSPDEERPNVADDARMHRVECLHHLRRADEVLRACKVLLQPFGARRISADAVTRAETTIAHRLAELGMLEMQPILFHTIATFDVVHRVAGDLAAVQSMLPDDVNRARAYWTRQLRREIAAALATVMREVERLLKKI